MMKFLTMALLGSATLTSAEVFPYSEVKESSLWEAFEEEGEATLYFEEGLTLPVQFSLEGDVLQLDDEISKNVSLKIKKGVYVKASESELYFSFDGEEWLLFSEIFQGMVRAEINQEKDNVLKIDWVLNERVETPTNHSES